MNALQKQALIHLVMKIYAAYCENEKTDNVHATQFVYTYAEPSLGEIEALYIYIVCYDERQRNVTENYLKDKKIDYFTKKVMDYTYICVEI